MFTSMFFPGWTQVEEKDSIRLKELEEIIITGTRAGKYTPVTYQNIKKEEIEKRNLAQDMPYMLAATPSLVYTSDAGTGVGYTGIRIRGSDATRINVTINGIPYNDSESQGVFWVNMPDFSSSVNSIQIQRGVGTSTNGAGAFGATINLETSVHSEQPFVELNNTFGSFNTRRHNIIMNTGLIDGKWSFEGKLAQINSDGYIDRASSDLSSYFLTGQYIGKNTLIKALAFGGKEVTYQAWNGVEQNLMKTNRTYNSAGLYFDDLGNEQFYDREVDDYRQDHFQLHFNQRMGSYWTMNAALHFTHGEGFFEQYREDEAFSDYGLQNVVVGTDTIYETDLIRRRWLDNDFYGFIYGFNYDRNRLSLTIGGGYHYYEGKHFGEVIWAQYASDGEIRQRYYDNIGKKDDFNTYIKANYDLNARLNVFADMQIRYVNYRTYGVDNDRRNIDVGEQYTFFNPKAGLTYQLNNRSSLYASYAVGNREPDRNDFVDSPTLPKHETLGDFELGYQVTEKNYTLSANFYYMNYRNQLVLTGALNDVGGAIRTNVEQSYRSGIELSGGYKFSELLRWNGNVTFSRNKITEYVEDLNDYLEGGISTTTYENTDIAYSPNLIAASEFTLTPMVGLDITLFSKYVGKQYLDNTGNDDRILNPYFVNDLMINYNFTTRLIKNIGINLMINNLFNTMYESNGYTFGYLYGEEYREVYLYPQSGINVLAGLKLRF